MKIVKKLTLLLIFTLIPTLAAGAEKLSEEINIALGKAPSQFASITDGDLKGGVLLGGGSNDGRIMISLGSQYYLKGINLFWEETLYSPDYKVEVSIDLVNWSEINRVGQEKKSDLGSIVDEAAADGEIGQFIRIEAQGEKEVRLNEIEVYPALDLKPEIVSEVRLVSLAEGSVEIAWETNIATTGQIHYKIARQPAIIESGDDIIVIEKAGENINVVLEGLPTKKHRLQLTGLLKGSEYVYWTVSKDLYRKEANSEQRILTTTGTPLPLVKSAKVGARTKDSVIIEWVTNVPTRGTINYSVDGNSVVS